jgi:hypothetical protein
MIKKNLLIVTVMLLYMDIQAQRKGAAVYKDSTVVSFFRRTGGWVAGDGAFSVALADGRTIWLTGDSHIDDYDKATHTLPCLFQVRNAALLQPARDWSWTHTETLTGNDPRSKYFYRTDSTGRYWHWPISGIQLGDTVYLYYSGLERAEGGFGFKNTDKDVWVKVKYPEIKIAGQHDLQDFNGINFGIGFIKGDKDGYVYAYGTKFNKEKNGSDLYVGRFPASDPNKPWEFWDGAAWSKTSTKAAIIARTAFSPQVSKVKNKYLLVSSALSVACDQGKDIYTAVSSRVTGPFSAPKAIYTLNDTLQGHYPFFYVPVAHPQFINDKGEILITYNVNGYEPCVKGCVNNRMNPDHYRPRGIRVPLKLIDPAL